MGPVRRIGPWVAAALGIVLIVRGAEGFSASGAANTSVLLYLGIGLVALGVVTFFLARWMARRGI